jgi:hypothetical protein
MHHAGSDGELGLQTLLSWLRQRADTATAHRFQGGWARFHSVVPASIWLMTSGP